MNNVWILARKELRIALRKNQLLFTAIVLLALLLVAGMGGGIRYRLQSEELATLQKEKREQWLEQGNKHPHIAAHYGTFVFKPKTALSVLDPGLDAYTGASIYLEAHYQHEFMFRQAQDFGAMIRFGELSVALVLQLLVPLLIIFLTFSSITAEREQGTMRIVLSQGVPLNQIVQGKILAYTIIVFSLLLPTLLLWFTGIFWPLHLGSNTDVALRLGLLVLAYGLYFFVWIVLGVWVSLQSSHSGKALLILLCGWITLCTIAPKTAAGIASDRYPLPSLHTYQQQVKAAIDAQISREPGKDRVILQLNQQLLARYKVKEIAQLPINYEAACAQAYEDFENRIHDTYTLGLQQLLLKQNSISKYLSLLNPYLAVRNISMSLSATDLNTYIHFQTRAEQYRRKMVRMLNSDYRDHSKTGEFYEYKADRDLWQALPDFQYDVPDTGFALKNVGFECVALGIWTLALTLFMFRSFKHTSL